MPTKKPPRINAPVALPKHVPDLIKEGHARCDAVDERHDLFQTPDPPLQTIRTALDGLQSAETKTATSKGATPERDAAEGNVRNLLDQLRQYIVLLARKNPAQAGAFFAAGRLSPKKTGAKPPKGFAMAPGKLAHEVVLSFPPYVGKGLRMRQVRLSADGGKTWLEPRNATKATLHLTDLMPAQAYVGEYRVVTTAGDGAWSDPLPFVVP